MHRTLSGPTVGAIVICFIEAGKGIKDFMECKKIPRLQGKHGIKSVTALALKIKHSLFVCSLNGLQQHH